MADSSLPLLDDTPSATPLDLLLNAISGSGHYHFAPEDNPVDPSGPQDNQPEPGVANDLAYLSHDHSVQDQSVQLGSTGPIESSNAPAKRERELNTASPRQSKIARTLSRHFAGGISAEEGVGDTSLGSTAFSTIEVWHPRTGQKSYGKERRLIHPPPTLRVTGPLFPLLTTVTLSTHPNPDPVTGARTFSSQTHRLALDDPTHTFDDVSEQALIYSGGAAMPPAGPSANSSHKKKAEREDKKRRMREAAAKTGWGGTLPWERQRENMRSREELADGITFPGLWVGEEVGKCKEFRLELTLGEPGGAVVASRTNLTEDPTIVAPDGAGQGQTPTEAVSTPALDEAALRRVLGDAAMADSMTLPGTGIEDASRLVDHLEAAQVSDPNIDPALQPSIEVPAAAPEGTDNQSNQQAVAVTNPLEESPKPWATFVSEPLTIVSKPSQKTAKARSMASCLSASDAFALWVRINAQTVRTKFMKIDEMEGDQPVLAARTGKWTPFRFDVLERACPPELEDKSSSRNRFKLDTDREAGVVTYGSIVQLVDVQTGVRSDPVRIVRVDKNEVIVGSDEGHPVSELQRIGLVRVVDGVDDLTDGGRWYLSAPGTLVGAGEVKTTRARPKLKSTMSEAVTWADGTAPLPETLNGLEAGAAPPLQSAEVATTVKGRRKKTKRHALAKAAITEEESGSTQATLVWSRATRAEAEHTSSDGKQPQKRMVTVETVDDWMCWILGGVGCFSYSFFNGLADAELVPRTSLDPIPRLLANPSFRPEQSTIDLTLSYFYANDPVTGAPQSLRIYLGPIGPLPTTTWRSVAPREKLYEPGALYAALPYSSDGTDDSHHSGYGNGHQSEPERARVLSNFPASLPHIIVQVELPDADRIIRAMQDCRGTDSASHALGIETAAAAEDSSNTVPQAPTQVSGDQGDVDHGVPAGDGQAQVVDDVPIGDDHSWLSAMDPTPAELTIQEALRNADKLTEGHAVDLSGHESQHIPPNTELASVGDNGDFDMNPLSEDLIDPTLRVANTATSHSNLDVSNTQGSIEAAALAAHSLDIASAATPTSAAPPPTNSTQNEAASVSTIGMHRPAQRGNDTLPPLPLLLVRPDGVGHGIGWSMTAERVLDPISKEQAEFGPSWGLRLVQTSGRGPHVTTLPTR